MDTSTRFKVFATAPNATDHSDGARPYACKYGDTAAQLCITLYRQGYAIHKVIMPGGEVISGAALDQVIKAGLRDVRLALKA